MSDYPYAENNDESVGQEEGNSNQEGSSNDWKEQAKYFQSEKDKLFEENKTLKDHAQIGKYLQERPEIAKKLSGIIKDFNDNGCQLSESEEKPSVGREEFDSWEAFNDPNSESYQQVNKSMKKEIGEAVNQAVGEVNKKANAKEGVKQIMELMIQRGYSEEEKANFFKFAKEGPNKYGYQGALDMFESVERKNIDGNDNTNDIIRRNQQNPVQGGILQGQQPAKKNESDELWKGILDAQPLGRDGKLP